MLQMEEKVKLLERMNYDLNQANYNSKSDLQVHKINANNKTLQAKNSVKSMHSQKPLPKN